MSNNIIIIGKLKFDRLEGVSVSYLEPLQVPHTPSVHVRDEYVNKFQFDVWDFYQSH